MSQRPTSYPRPSRYNALVLVSLCVVAALTACSGPEVGGSSTPSTASGTPTPTPVTCAQALPGAKADSVGGAFAELPLHASALSHAPVQVLGDGDGQFTLVGVALCSENTSAARIRTFFSG